MQNKEQAPQGPNYPEQFSQLSEDEKKVLLAFILVQAGGESLTFITGIVRDAVTDLAAVLSSLVEKGHIIFEAEKYEATDRNFVTYIQTNIAKWS